MSLRYIIFNMLAVGLAVLAVAPATGQVAQRGSNSVHLSTCVVSLVANGDVQVPAQQPGVLMKLEVTEGARVNADDLLGSIDDIDARLRVAAAEAQLRAAQAEAENDINVRAAVASAKVADAEFADSVEINRRAPGTIAATQLRREQLTAERERLRIDVARMEQEVAGYTVEVRQAEVDAAKNEIVRRQVKAPINGEIVHLYRSEGEWVQPGDPILRLVRMDRLRVEGFVDGERFSPRDVYDAEAKIVVHMPGNRVHETQGRISHVSPIVEANGNYRVWAEVDNKIDGGFWVLQPGQTAEMEIRLGTARAAAGR